MSLMKRMNQTQAGDEAKVFNIPTEKRPKTHQEIIETRLRDYLIEELKQYQDLSQDELSETIKELAEPFLEEEGDRLTFEAKKDVTSSVTNDLVGLGPITPFIHDETVTEVMVNGPSEIYVERNGKITRTNHTFKDNRHVANVIERIVNPLGRRIDESNPMVDARLSDGSRVNAIIPPLALNGPTITIRKFSKEPFKVDDLLRFGTFNQEMADFLKACVQSYLNVFVSGGTGSGKTTTLNVLSSFIQNTDRIITIEDAAELKLHQDHIISLESRPPNIEGQGEITIRDLVRNSLRMRPDRIVVGEVRSAEALDMLQAMNTGHDGSLGTGHANSPRDMLARLETMVLMAGMDLPIKAIREQIAGAIDLIIHQSRMKDGTRKITHISEVLGMEENTIVMQDIFVFKQTGVSPSGKIEGHFQPTGIRPQIIDQLEQNGIDLPPSLFRGEW
ncbi:CpaF family protein [Alkalibacillus haloalkaliphilus]|uniref:CpaF family protein n=1 Tax=Alkalibacillus haloalkaliphilus TaxID=94136 RepID=UPI0029367169|nr:CpaF family protein [Alkalibacillus haloalkaliphilus]MDV2580750.1 CpaF family protein [Alkalibacillus haloalkaliphilus]